MKGKKMLARPYANAIFEIASTENAFGLWSERLALLAYAAENPSLQASFHDPRYTPKELSEIFIAVLEKAGLHNPAAENLVHLLASYQRLPILALIADLYESRLAAAAQILFVTIRTAFTLTSSLQENLKNALLARFKKTMIKLTIIQDSTLLGGAIISAEGQVIDYSARNLLSQLQQSLIG